MFQGKCGLCNEPYFKHHTRTMQNYHQFQKRNEPVVDAYSYNKLVDINEELLEALKFWRSLDLQICGGKAIALALKLTDEAVAKAEGNMSVRT